MNPFIFGQVVTDQHFCRRNDLEKQLLQRIENAQNTMICGDRRVGKTSLIKSVVTSYSENSIFVDLSGIKTEPELIQCMIQGVVCRGDKSHISKFIETLRGLKATIDIGPLKVRVDPAQKADQQSIRGILHAIKQGFEKKAYVVVFDEFQEILQLKNSESAIAALRSIVQHEGKTPFLFAGSSRNDMHTIFNHPKSPFFKGAAPLDVGSLERETFIPFLEKKFRKNKLRPTPSYWDLVYSVTEGISGDVQQLCSAVWETSKANIQLNEKAVRIALERIFAHESRTNEYIIKRCSPLQKGTIIGLATLDCGPTSTAFLQQMGASSGGVAKALKTLTNEGIIWKLDKRYHFSSPFFREWLRAKY
jgi:hypothetical protein